MVTTFDLSNANSIFQEYINNAIRDSLDEFFSKYINNILVYSSIIFDKNQEDVNKVFEKNDPQITTI